MTAIDASLPKKERILIAAEDVFSRRGYTKATLDEIMPIPAKARFINTSAIKTTFFTR